MEYVHLTEARDNYIEQFLLHTKLSLVNHLTLDVSYRCVRKITRINCSTIHYFYTFDICPISELIFLAHKNLKVMRVISHGRYLS